MDKKIDKYLTDQQAYFESQATRSVRFRKEKLKRFRDMLKENEDRLNAAINADFKKSEFDTFTNELALLYLDIDEAIAKLRNWSRRKRVNTNVINFPAKSFIYPDPLGSTLIIGAWNYPFQLSFAPVIAAMAAGCTMTLKPSEVPSNTSSVIAELVGDYFDPAYFQVVEGGVEETTALLKLKWDKIFFTGSVPVGKIVYRAAAENLVPVTLELGGKSPAIITKDANLDLAVRRIVWGKFLNAGQTCIAPDYVAVAKEVKAEFIQRLINRIAEMNYDADKGNYVQIINDKNVQRLEKLIQEDQVVYGGNVDQERRCIEPTVMDNVTFDDKIMEDEIFGPILPVITFEHLTPLLAKIKEKPSPLSCYLFTNKRSVKDQVISELRFGGGAINDTIMHITNSKLPFGGVGDSGIGNYHGKAGFDAFTHYKSILDKSTWLDPDFKYPPYTKKKMKWVRWLLRI